MTPQLRSLGSDANVHLIDGPRATEAIYADGFVVAVAE
jgi:hypothetical protein